MYKLISLDMDNTTLNPEHKISKRTKKALQEAHKKGIKVIMNTGRTYQEAEAYIDELDFVDYIVTSNGSVVFDKTENVFHQVNSLERKYVQLCHQVCKAYSDDILLLVAGETECYSDKIYQNSKAKSMFEGFVGIEINMIDELLAFFENKFIGKAVIIGDNSLLEEIRIKMQALLKTEIQLKYSLDCALEVMSPKMDKSEGVKWIMDKFDIAQSEIIAIGDGENDIGMIKQAALGIAMENACDSLKKVADYITLSNAEDGVAYAIEKFVLV